jgi:hypothetical protein
MRVDVGKLTKVVGGVVLGLVALGMIINAKDIRRYVRMTTM